MMRVGHRVLDVEAASRVDGEPLPSSMKGLLREGRGALSRVQALAKAAQSSAGRYSTAMLEEKAIRFLPPLPDPDRFLCMDEASRAQLEETGASLVGHNAKVAAPAAARLECEPALVFVVGRRALGVTSEDDAMDYVVGVTLMAGIANRDAGEGAAGPSAMGPELVTMDEVGDPDHLWVTCVVNGEERLRVNAGEQVRKMGEILERFSRGSALEPGDMFSTGVPGDEGPRPNGEALKPGDVAECSIEGITTLRIAFTAA
jgi:2-keto-4-pentenoate hydratase/2-oxohepta-3-ene-1,7-dioic acid hydratase in catechol pathway